MDNLQAKCKRIAAFAGQYQEEELPDEVSSDDGDPFDLRFFLESAFASARNEETSAKYRKATETVLRENCREINDRLESDTRVSEMELLDDLQDAGVTNRRDRQMVVQILEFIEEIPDDDVIGYVQRKVANEELEDAHERLTDIYNIGSKKATLFLRDAVTLLDHDECVACDDYKYLFPVDTWVRGVVDELGIVDTDAVEWDQNSSEIINELPDCVSPIEFNQGAWYVGANAFDVLMENLSRIESNSTVVY